MSQQVVLHAPPGTFFASSQEWQERRKPCQVTWPSLSLVAACGIPFDSSIDVLW
jgi:hypothetical protein